LNRPGLAVPRFRPRFPWLGGDLQTVRNFLVARPPDLAEFATERLTFEMPDGSGDRLVASLHRTTPDAPRKPLAVLIHGLTGCEDSSYVRVTARHLLAAAYPVLRLNLRGAGPSRPTCRFAYHAGRSDDLAAIVGALDPSIAEAGVVMVGYSLGGNMLLKFVAECGERSLVRAVATVSVPIDLAASAARLMRPRNWIYHRWLLARMIDEALAPGSDLSAAERRAAASARTIRDFDDVHVAPRNGFAGADDYYARCSSRSFLPAIRTPTLAVHAEDDPWIAAEGYADSVWRTNPNLTLLMARSGGHVGFHAAGERVPWHDRCLIRFFDEHVAEALSREQT
jgi:predicted alpha/beta-fold hydrolase